MIEGLKVTVSGEELKQMCMSWAAHHSSRVAKYRDQIDQMKTAQIEGMAYTNGDPIKAVEDRMLTHMSESHELLFIAEHLKLTEEYVLGREDLVKLGIAKSRYQ